MLTIAECPDLRIYTFGFTVREGSGGGGEQNKKLLVGSGCFGLSQWLVHIQRSCAYKDDQSYNIMDIGQTLNRILGTSSFPHSLG